MSQFDQPQQQFSEYDEPMPGEKRSNPLGLVGFILSITCILAPLGFLLSLIALLKKPRGFAIAGVILGLILSVVPLVLITGVIAAASFATQFEQLPRDLSAVRSGVSSYQSANNALPATLADFGNPVTDDPWGNAYAYRVTGDGENWVLTSAGVDGTMNTPDDLVFDGYTPDGVTEMILGIEAMRGIPLIGPVMGEAAGLVYAAVDVMRLEAAINAYAAANNGDMPASLTDAPGIDEGLATDPWGTPYRYDASVGVDSIESAGPDGQFGTSDDLTKTEIDGMSGQMPPATTP